MFLYGLIISALFNIVLLVIIFSLCRSRSKYKKIIKEKIKRRYVVKPLKNNYMVEENVLNNTPEDITKVKEGINMVNLFQKEVDNEITNNFLKKLDRCHMCIKKDLKLLSLRWNTIETLFNVDNISEYVEEHKHQGDLITPLRRTLSSGNPETKSTLEQIPHKIKEIRENLSTNTDLLQEIIGDMKSEIGSEAEGESEEDEENSSEEEGEGSNANITHEESEPKEFPASDLILETVEEEENQHKKNGSPDPQNFLNISTNFHSGNLRNAQSINRKLSAVENVKLVNRSASKAL
ncbi:unnamed protein product [Moneuplotes crassus]|uniref:Uncharacterized protein n=1 Tax=Euplotes crassus TaxID=5936 RepID=A0AAD2CXS8_EUPCR|nr:unnamed protein product [Moneuplotes crassus]